MSRTAWSVGLPTGPVGRLEPAIPVRCAGDAGNLRVQGSPMADAATGPFGDGTGADVNDRESAAGQVLNLFSPSVSSGGTTYPPG